MPKRKDDAMLGVSKYERAANDFYPTPPRETNCLLEVIGDDLSLYRVWEPCCGEGDVVKVIAEVARDVLATDIAVYPKFKADMITDFLSIMTILELDEFLANHHNLSDYEWHGRMNRWCTTEDIASIKGFYPDAIITNPPYGDDAEAVARRALILMRESNGIVALLCRHEWDTAKGRSDIFDHPAFCKKITLRHRPRWIANSTGSPRHNYAWYVWDWTKANLNPTAKAELHYVA